MIGKFLFRLDPSVVSLSFVVCVVQVTIGIGSVVVVQAVNQFFGASR